VPLNLGPAARLRSHSQFKRVQDRGRRVARRSMTMLGLPNACDCDRLGIIASRRLGGAVVRNRAKRRLREVFRRMPPDPADRPALHLDLVAIARRELLTLPFTAIETDFHVAVRTLRGMK
jgi:ribonuclease P protein component